jgi:mannose-1-phosphate guanylyltransferase
VPKPLLPVRGVTVAEVTLERLHRAGCEAVAINLHHLGGEVRRAFGDSFRGMPLVYSEEPEILGTLGALAPLADFFAGCDAAVMVNGDSLCRWPLSRLLRLHRRTRAAVTLLVSSRVDPAAYGGGIAVGPEGRVISFSPGKDPEKVRRRVFAGVHVLAPELLARAPERVSHVVHDLYEPYLAEGGTIHAWPTGRPWYDLGTPRRYRDAAIGGGVAPAPIRALRRSWVAPDARVAPSASLRRTVLEAASEVGAGARVRGSLVLPGARIGEGARLEGCVVGPGAELPPGTRVRGRLICRRTAGATLPAGSSVVGDLLYAPLDPLTPTPTGR